MLHEKVLSWDFPITRPHEGMLLANSTQGLMVWGDSSRLVLTVSRAGFWDHRGSIDFATGTTFREVRWYLYSGDFERLKRAFLIEEGQDNSLHPHQIGGGRIIIDLPAEWNLTKGRLHLRKGLITVGIKHNDGREREISIFQDPSEELTYVLLPQIISETTGIELHSAYEYNGSAFKSSGISPPTFWKRDFEQGFIQYLPDDLPLALGWRKNKEEIIIGTTIDRHADEEVRKLLTGADMSESARKSLKWWQDYWNSVPDIILPDPVLQEIVDYGLFKQACCTAPQGVPCTLQGPFMEVYQFPPWSNDYHFNINQEMIYWPALASNRTENLEPMWKMIWSWLPDMKANGSHFFENENALTIPHAVDDRGKIPGAFWTGMMDHASTAWMAQLAWLDYRYTMDRPKLDTLAWPLLNGAFEGYWSMLTKVPVWGGDYKYSLLYSVSPEYRGSAINAWGRDASFQLAALHMLVNILKEAAEIMGEEEDPRWQDVADHLPEYSLAKVPVSPENQNRIVERIGLWDGLDLQESHRHHSHLAAVYPFCTIDPDDSTFREVIDESVQHWIREGAGAWSGWSIPWASVIHSRVGNTEAAVGWLHYWKEHYTNAGRGTLHDADYPGFSIITSPCWEKTDGDMHEIMQLDAGFGALNAVFELLVSMRHGVIYVLPDLHRFWKDLEFKGILTEGAFLIDAKVKNGEITQVSVKSLKGGELRINPGMKNSYHVNGEKINSPVLERIMQEGEVLEISAD